MSDSTLHSPLGSFELLPLHWHPRSPLRAWNAADELLLAQCAASPLPTAARVLVVNDHSGALAIALHAWRPDSWNDSFCSRLALEQNLARNQLPADCVNFLPADTPPDGMYDAVLLQLPKTLALLEQQLVQLRPHLNPQALIMAGGMLKHMPASMTDAFTRLTGPAKTSLAQKKARLVFARFDPQLAPTLPAPQRYPVPGTPLQLVSHANVFSQQKLDIGTRFLLENFPEPNAAQSILDLGCGNGALGIFAGWHWPQARLHFVDDSFLALKSARESCALNELKNPLHFHAGDALEQFDGTVDAILCNPPFHEGNRVHTDIAARMFRGAARHLTAQGTLTIVANRHLDYRPLLNPHFRQVKLVTGNNKFVILQARK